MTNALTTNPIMIDTAGANLAIPKPMLVKCIQWVDDNADIADNDDLLLVINGATVTLKPQLNLSNPVKGVAYEVNFGGKPFLINRLTVTTIDSGQLLFWLE
jgi:hypothetical protein